MKILMLTQTYYPSVGGGIRYKKAVVDHFRARGDRVDVLAVNTSGRITIEVDDGGTVLRMPQVVRANSTQFALGYGLAFRSLAPQYDILHFNFPSPMAELAQVIHARSARRPRKVAMYHADIVPAKAFAGPYNTFVTTPFLKAMDAIIVSSPKVKASSPHLSPHLSKVHVIPFGLDLTAFDDARPAEAAPADNAPLEVLFVGRLSRYKGLEYLLKALAGAPGRLTVVGAGPLRAEAEGLCRSLGVDSRVAFLGPVDDGELLQRYHAADVLVLPSIDAGEAFGYVLMEAMACRTAIVSTELGTGTSFVNENGVTGYVVPPRDPEAIRRVLATLDADRARLHRLKEAARQRVDDHFTIGRMLSATESLYGEALARARRR